MKIILLLCGKTQAGPIAELCEDYFQRLQHYWSFESQVLPDLKRTKNLSSEQVKGREAEQILKSLDPADHLILLDEKGRSYSSEALAQQMERWFHQSPRRLVFAVGGPYGFDPAVYARAQGKISLSAMTFSHQLIRVLFAEQLYRAASIIKGDPYHHA